MLSAAAWRTLLSCCSVYFYSKFKVFITISLITGNLFLYGQIFQRIVTTAVIIRENSPIL